MSYQPNVLIHLITVVYKAKHTCFRKTNFTVEILEEPGYLVQLYKKNYSCLLYTSLVEFLLKTKPLLQPFYLKYNFVVISINYKAVFATLLILFSKNIVIKIVNGNLTSPASKVCIA